MLRVLSSVKLSSKSIEIVSSGRTIVSSSTTKSNASTTRSRSTKWVGSIVATNNINNSYTTTTTSIDRSITSTTIASISTSKTKTTLSSSSSSSSSPVRNYLSNQRPSSVINNNTYSRYYSTTFVRSFAGRVADHCNLNVVKSPYAPIPNGPYEPLYEFITSNWESTGSSKKNESTIPKDKVAIIDIHTGLQRTFDDYYKTATKLAGYLTEICNIKEITGTVALYSPNHVDYLPTSFAVSICGAKLTPINPLNTVHELSSILHRSRASVIVTHSSKLDIAKQAAAQQNGHIQHIIVLTDSDTDDDIPFEVNDEIVTLNSIRNNPNQIAITRSIQNLHSGDTSKHPYCIPYSSGTTGLPKGVSLSHANMICNVLQLYEIEQTTFLPHHILISPLPFYHIYAFTVSLLYNAKYGQTLITSSGRFDLEQFCTAVQQHKPNRAHLVPPIIIGLTKHPVVDNYDLSSLRMIVSAAAPLSSDTEQALQERLYGTCRVKQAWGMSELSPIGTYTHDESVRSGSVGPLVPSTFAKIIDPTTGTTLGPNEPGELCIKGPQVMMGYLDDPDKTSECLSAGGWLRTGDVAKYDDDGYIYITDRMKELIKVNGYPVAPAELEALLLTHPSIADAAVISIPHEPTGEAPRAYIVLKESAAANNITEDVIYDWVAERVAPYKRLRGGIVLSSYIPKSAAGKILRRLLKDEYVQSLSSSSSSSES